MDQKIVNIQVLRAGAAIAVVLSHLYLLDLSTASASVPAFPQAFIYGFSGVDLFFVISGFVMALVSRGRFGSPSRAGAFLFSRAARIYPPYWLYTLAAIAGMAVMGGLADKLDQVTLWRSLVLWPDLAGPLLPVGWTLVHEMYFYLVFALIMLAPQRALAPLLALWGAATVAGALAGLRGTGDVASIVFSPLTLEFIAGAYVGLLVASGRRRLGWAALAVGVAAMVPACLLLGAPEPDSFSNHWARAAAFTPPCVLMVYGAACVEVDSRARAPGALVALGDWSYSLYLLHVLVIVGVYSLWADRMAGWLDNWLLGAICMAGSILTACLSFRYFERPSLVLAGRLRDRIAGPRTGAAPAGAPRLASRIW